MAASSNYRARIVSGQVALASMILLIWQYGSASHSLDPFFFSSPADIAVRVTRWFATGMIWQHLLVTFAEALLSFAIGSLLGITLGLALARYHLASAILEPYIRVANSLPRVVLAPIFLLWFGLGIWSKVALGVTVVFFVVFFNTYRGVREVDQIILNNVRMLGGSDRQLIRHVLIPSALTWIFSSLHVSIGLAIIAVVVGEYMGSSRGVGYVIAQAEGVFDTTGAFAGLTVLAIGVLMIGALVNRVERHLLRWKPNLTESRPEEHA
jgi:NitT/TauT family transport system permease protein